MRVAGIEAAPNKRFETSFAMLNGRVRGPNSTNRTAPGVKTGIERHDYGIAAGAAGATTFIMRGSHFSIPGGSEDCERDPKKHEHEYYERVHQNLCPASRKEESSGCLGNSA